LTLFGFLSGGAISNPPEDKTKSAGHISIAWPTALALDERSGKSGFIMPRIKATIGLHQLYHPKARRETAPNITWEHIVSIGYNLSTVVNSLHEKGYVIGDLNESNILVNDRSLISLIDCDSMQVQDRTTTYYCTVAKREYAAPELIGQDLSSLKRSPDSDVFSLAVLLFMLLMEGTSPFAGTQLGNLTLEEQKQTGNSPYLPAGTLQPPVSAPPFDILPKQI